MRTSKLISILQELQKDIPFDADVVSGDDYMPARLERVYHEPPHTFLQFSGEIGIGVELDKEVMTAILEDYKASKVSLDDALNRVLAAIS